MNCLRRVTSTGLALIMAIMFLFPLSLVSAETLADIDAEIQSNRTIKTDRGGYDAYNIYEGVTTDRLVRKWTILNAAGVSSYFLTADYKNFS